MTAPAGHTATLEIATGTRVLGQTVLPPGFAPAAQPGPMWLNRGAELAIPGMLHGRSVVFGFDPSNLQQARLLAADFGAVAPGGAIIDVAPSPDGMTLALAVQEPTSSRIDIILHDIMVAGEHSRIASFDGQFDLVTMSWIGPNTIAVGLRTIQGVKTERTTPNGQQQPAQQQPAPAGGLYLVDTNGLGSATRVAIGCELSALSWSPNGTFAAGEGDTRAVPVLIDSHNAQCLSFKSHSPIRVLDWSPAGNSFVYATSAHRSVGTFTYDLSTGRSALVAIASAAAAYMSDGAVLALGSQRLSWKSVAEAPTAMVPAQLAIISPKVSQVEIMPLGTRTTPALLAASRMIYTKAGDSAAIDLLSPGTSGPLRQVIAFLTRPRIGLRIAYGPATGALLLSWSPNGRELALIDVSQAAATLTIVSPAAELEGSQKKAPMISPGGSKAAK